MTYPQQQPPVMHGYSPTPPNGDWAPAPRPPAKKRGPLPWLIGALVVAVLGMGGLITWLAVGAGDDKGRSEPAAAAGPMLAAAKTECNADEGVTLADGDKTMVIDAEGDKDPDGTTPTTQLCILTKLGVPVAVTEHMDSTRSVDGRQTATWPGYSASWTYHPDQGLDVIVTSTS